jgi:hypothetical protein
VVSAEDTLRSLIAVFYTGAATFLSSSKMGATDLQIVEYVGKLTLN